MANNQRSAQSAAPDWEKYTKGIGSKLLAKMGYKAGQGLGKDNEGISKPIKMKVNKGRTMLGLATDMEEDRRTKRGSSKKDIQYDSDNSNSSSDLDSELPKFVKDEVEQVQDEDSPAFIAERLLAVNANILHDLRDKYRTEEANQGLLMKALADYRSEKQHYEDLIESLRGVLSTIQYLEAINRTDKLELENFWESIPSTSISQTTRCHMIQVFALPLLKKTYNRLIIQSQPNKVDDVELERKLFSNMIDVAREWLKTKACYDQLIDWYLEWKKIFEEIMSTSKRVKYFRRKLLDVMFLATIQNHRDLNSFRYIPYKDISQESQPKSSRRTSRYDDRDTENTPVGFKQLVEQTAMENGLVFRPSEGRTHDSKQIYKLEKLNIYIDNKVIFVRKDDRWLPKTLDDVINLSLN